MRLDASFTFRVPSDPRVLAVIRAVVGELGSVYGLPDEDCRSITLAVDEAMANIIRHAYRGARDRTIEVHCEGRDDRLEFTLLDEGQPPDPGCLKPHSLDNEALGGRGTYIIRSVMDEVHYERVPRGNQVRLSKRLPAAKVLVEGDGRDV